MGLLEGRAALITGGARGFGRALAHLLASEGADVAIADIADQPAPMHFADPLSLKFAYMSTQADLDATVRSVSRLGGNVIGIKADVTQARECEAMRDQTLSAFGKIDILCPNAGVISLGQAWDLTEEEWDWIVDVNLKGAWLTTKYIVPCMIERRSGKVVFTASRNGLKAEPYCSHYVASKHALLGYMKALAIELGPFGINVNAVCPTLMGNRFGRGGDHAGTESNDQADNAADWAAENLFEDHGVPEFDEVAEGVLWLVSDKSRLVTGLALPMDAGWIVKRGG